LKDSSRETMTVLVLTRNEAENLTTLVCGTERILTKEDVDYSVLIVDAGSSDGSPDIAQRLGARVIQQSKPGYANALREGLAASSGDLVLTIDADLSHQPDFILDLLAKRRDAEIVIASRYVDGGSGEMSPTRRILSLALNRTFARVLGLEIADLSSGFRLYRREAIASLDPRGEHFDILPEIVVLAHRAGLRILEVPFHYHPREAGVSKARALRFAPSYLQTLARCRRHATGHSQDQNGRPSDLP